MNDGRQTPPPPEAWKIRFLANGTPGTWFYTDDAAVTKECLRTHCDDVEVIPLCRMHDGPVFREHHINEHHINRVGSLAAAACHGLKLPL
ncbi:hypothetical protein NOR82_005714 [Escherichia coli]|nr:hypothetical protein [Escherichia coli]EJM6485609.1 hypothetical protein [Escherichia coli]EKL2187492.1 hypothetical protein [Escherichia coli]EKL4136718.1 hypothetical protein [Escherichia coli]EKN2766825.1 hypothetical protein [Escherichia coli]